MGKGLPSGSSVRTTSSAPAATPATAAARNPTASITPHRPSIFRMFNPPALWRRHRCAAGGWRRRVVISGDGGAAVAGAGEVGPRGGARRFDQGSAGIDGVDRGADQRADFAGCVGAAAGEAAHFGRTPRESTAVISGASGL